MPDSNAAPVFIAGAFVTFAVNPFAGIDVDRFRAPTFADLDGDGDLDLAIALVSGMSAGTVLAYRNQAPSPAVTFAENGTGLVLQRSATDAEGDTVTYALSGANAALFALDSVTGAIGFRAAPDFEAPPDADGDNVYDVILTASDGVNATPLVITVSSSAASRRTPAPRRRARSGSISMAATPTSSLAWMATGCATSRSRSPARRF